MTQAVDRPTPAVAGVDTDFTHPKRPGIKWGSVGSYV